MLLEHSPKPLTSDASSLRRLTAGAITAAALLLSIQSSQAQMNLAESATGFGVLGGGAITTGAASWTANGLVRDPGQSITGLRADGSSQFQPYMTWDTARSVSSVRIYNDYVN